MKQGFTVHHNGPPVPETLFLNHGACHPFWEGIRRYHIQTRGWSDIAYSFGICPHGTLFIGRGWHKNQFANGEDQVGADNGRDREWYSVLCFIGGRQRPPYPMEQALEDLIRAGRNSGLCGDRVAPHNWWKNKPCPGPDLTRWCAQHDQRPLHDPRTSNKELPDMFLYTAPNQPVFFCDGGKSVGLNEATDLPTFTLDNNVPMFKLDDDTFRKFRERFPGA